MQTPVRNFEESKPITAGAMTPFNVNCYDVIRDLVIEFTDSGSPATLANCLSSIDRVVVLINGMNAVDVKLSQIVDLFTFLGTRVNQTTLTNVFSLNIGRLLYNAGLVRDEFAWRCGKLGTVDPTKKISSLVVQIYAGATVTNITDVKTSKQTGTIHTFVLITTFKHLTQQVNLKLILCLKTQMIYSC